MRSNKAEKRDSELSTDLITARDNAFDASNCNAVNTDIYPIAAPGIQKAVSPITPCSGGVRSFSHSATIFTNKNHQTCSFAATTATMQGTTLTTSTDTTITNSLDVSIAIGVGIEFPVEFDTTVTAGYSFSKAVAKGTSSAVTNSTTFTTSSTLSQQSGKSIPFFLGVFCEWEVWHVRLTVWC